MKRSWIQRSKKPMRNSAGDKSARQRRRQKAISPRGKKVREWEQVRAELKKELERIGITYCEFGFDNCTGTENLSLAHSVKRRFLGRDEQREQLIREVACACFNCHDRLDIYMSHEEMKRAVLKAIEDRPNKIARAA